MHIGSPAGQILNLSVNQMEEQLWVCTRKTSGELLGSTECRALLKTHPPLQTITKTSFFQGELWLRQARLVWCRRNRAGDEALLCKYRIWQWNEELQGKQTEERVSRGTGSSGGSDSMEAASDWPWQSCVSYRSHLFPQKRTGTNRNSHCSERLSQQNTERIQQWEKNISLFLFNTPLFYKISPLLLERPYIPNSFMDL